MMIIALGSNLESGGDKPAENVRRAIRVLDRMFTLSKISSLYSSPAWPERSDPPFINAVVSSEKTLPPALILKALHSIEAAFGRERSIRNAPRILDLDLLAVNEMIIRPNDQNMGKGEGAPMNETGLTLPHPRMANRAFVLVPLAQIMPDWKHPETGLSALEMLENLGEVEIEAYSD